MGVRTSKTKDLGRRPDGYSGGISGLGGTLDEIGIIRGRGVIKGRVIIKCRWHKNSGGIIT